MADNKLLGAGSLYFRGNEITKAYMGNNLVWEKTGGTEIDYSKEYFCIEAVDDCDITFEPQATRENGHIFFYVIFHGAGDYRPTMEDLYMMFENGENYEVYDPNEYLQLSISLYSGDIVYMIGNMDQGVSKYNTSIDNTFTFSGRVNLSGNIMSLTHGIDRNTLDITVPLDLPEKTYTQYTNSNVGELGRLFKKQPVVDAGNLVLSSSILNSYTYWEMFYGCTSLTTAPVLPATTLANYCYGYMFMGCTSLTTAPVLPATTLASSCYRRMFMGCTSLTTAPVLPATTLVLSCYTQMFQSCTSLNYIKAMFTTKPGASYNGSWVGNVSATGTFVKNSAATWNVTGNNGVPSGWTVQTASS